MRKADEVKNGLIDFGKRIRALREFHHLTIEQTADKLGLTANYYGKVERGVHTLSYEGLKKFSKEFNTSIDYLLTGEVKTTMESPIIGMINDAPENKRIYLEEILLAATKIFDK